MSKDEIRKLCKEARNKGGYTTTEMILDLWEDDEDIPDQYLELFIHKIEPREIVLHVSMEMADKLDKMFEEEWEKVKKDLAVSKMRRR
jgi:hypothetical protein